MPLAVLNAHSGRVLGAVRQLDPRGMLRIVIWAIRRPRGTERARRVALHRSPVRNARTRASRARPSHGRQTTLPPTHPHCAGSGLQMFVNEVSHRHGDGPTGTAHGAAQDGIGECRELATLHDALLPKTEDVKMKPGDPNQHHAPLEESPVHPPNRPPGLSPPITHLPPPTHDGGRDTVHPQENRKAEEDGHFTTTTERPPSPQRPIAMPKVIVRGASQAPCPVMCLGSRRSTV